VATVVLVKDHSVQPDPLASSIHIRISNRRPYRHTALTDLERTTLSTAALRSGAGSSSFYLLTGRRELRQLGRVAATNEEVMLANQSLHQFFFSHVSWTPEEDAIKKMGFYIKTLELPRPAELMFKVFRKWSIMRPLSLLGFNTIVAVQNSVVNASASAIGAIAISATDPLDFVKAGRAVERVWLTATSLGLAFQPLTGLFFFYLRILNGERNPFSSHQRMLIIRACERATRIFGITGKQIAFMFRIGHAPEPSAHAVRFPLVDVVTVVS